jgi:hypothetical protein
LDSSACVSGESGIADAAAEVAAPNSTTPTSTYQTQLSPRTCTCQPIENGVEVEERVGMGGEGEEGVVVVVVVVVVMVEEEEE